MKPYNDWTGHRIPRAVVFEATQAHDTRRSISRRGQLNEALVLHPHTHRVSGTLFLSQPITPLWERGEMLMPMRE